MGVNYSPIGLSDERNERLVAQANGLDFNELRSLIASAPIDSDSPAGRRHNFPDSSLSHDSSKLVKLAYDQAIADGMSQEEAKNHSQKVSKRALNYARRLTSLANFEKGVRTKQEQGLTQEAEKMLAGQRAGEGLIRHTLQNGKVAVGLRADALLSIINGDGQYRTLFENPGVRNLGVINHPQGRAENEQINFGIPLDADPTTRPAFGYLISDGFENEDWFTALSPDMQNKYKTLVSLDAIGRVGRTDGARIGSPAFGDARVVLKRDVLDRTTYAVDGTFATGTFPRPVTAEPTKESMALAGAYGRGQGFTTGRGDGLISESNGFIDPTLSFIEAQVHGRFTLDDVEAIYVSAEKAPEIESALRAKGIGIEVRIS